MLNVRIIPLLLITTLLFLQPTFLLAQTRQRYNPNVTIQGNGGTFGGVTFSGVGAAVLGCTNVAGGLSGLISKGTNSLAGMFKSNPTSRLSTPATSQTGASQISQNINSSASSPASSISVSGNIKNALGVSANQTVPVNDDAVRLWLEKSKKELEKANQRENCLNGIAYAVAKSLLQQVVNKTLNWVNTGFGGNPVYVRDIDSFLKTVSDQKIERFLQKIPNDDPIFGNAIRSLVTEQVSGLQDGLIGKVMDTPEARAYESFQEDFTNGGWDAFLNPRYSAIDAYFDAAEKLDKDVSTATENVLEERRLGSGFLDFKQCIEHEDLSLLKRFVADCDKNNNCGAAAYQDATNKIANPACIKYQTVTPGATIQAQVEAVTTSQIRQLEQADQINEVLGAFFDQLLNKLFAFGLKNIGDRSSGQWSYGGLGSNVVLGANGQPLSSIDTGILGYQSGGSYDISDFDISRPQQLRSILQAQYDYLNHNLDSHIALNRILPLAGALDYCMPGPNPTWQDGFNENTQAYFGNLQEVQEGSSVFQQVLQSIPIIGGLFGGGGSHTIAAVGTQLYDKASGQSLPITDTVFHERNRSPGAIFNNVKARYDEVVAYYTENYTKDKIESAFQSVDPSNSAFVSGFIDDSYDEMESLPGYSVALLEAELEGSYSKAEEDTRDAIREIEAIRTEVNALVTTAKARYIQEQAAAGTPVNQSCIDAAYTIDNSPLTPAARLESDTPSPLIPTSVEANSYFYGQL